MEVALELTKRAGIWLGPKREFFSEVGLEITAPANKLFVADPQGTFSIAPLAALLPNAPNDGRGCVEASLR